MSCAVFLPIRKDKRRKPRRRRQHHNLANGHCVLPAVRVAAAAVSISRPLFIFSVPPPPRATVAAKVAPTIAQPFEKSFAHPAQTFRRDTVRRAVLRRPAAARPPVAAARAAVAAPAVAQRYAVAVAAPVAQPAAVAVTAHAAQSDQAVARAALAAAAQQAEEKRAGREDDCDEAVRGRHAWCGRSRWCMPVSAAGVGAGFGSVGWDGSKAPGGVDPSATGSRLRGFLHSSAAIHPIEAEPVVMRADANAQKMKRPRSDGGQEQRNAQTIGRTIVRLAPEELAVAAAHAAAATPAT
ncbi:hypothetical protein DFJ73DRAFT_961430 [Zopfochytrium polystomum]|nr:hypothetical protein DFJ73DRAFT_961430 [Zopfochytrium polystomum]